MLELSASVASADVTPTPTDVPVVVPKEESTSSSRLNTKLVVPLATPGEDNPLLERLDRIRAVCGDLCSINDRDDFDAHKVEFPESSFGHRFEFPSVDCDAIVASTDIDAADQSAPRKPPHKLMPYFTLHGMIRYEKYHRFTNFYLAGEALETVWTKEMINADLASLDAGSLEGSYGADFTMPVYEQMKQNLNLKGKSVLVIGSERPWFEAICLHLGAAQVTTLEYGKITSHHPQIKTMIPSEFQQAYKAGQLLFDMVVSFSSLEHPGWDATVTP